jgi:hypothetical protein
MSRQSHGAHLGAQPTIPNRNPVSLTVTNRLLQGVDMYQISGAGRLNQWN